MSRIILATIFWVLSWFGTGGVPNEVAGEPNKNTDYLFSYYIYCEALPEETQIPWSAEHYIELAEQYKADTTLYEIDEFNGEGYAKEEKKETVVETTTTSTPASTAVAGDLGVVKIPTIGVNVGLYSDANAFQSSGKASVQYYTQYGIFWIADHVNQDGFGGLKNLSIGSKVYVNDTEYTVAENLYYADYYSNFNGCGVLTKMDEYKSAGGLMLQTCEGNGARIIFCN